MKKKNPSAILFFVFGAFLLLGLPLVYDPFAIDVTLIPRLLALNIFLFFFLLGVLWVPVTEAWNFTALRNRVVFCYAAYAAITLLSLLFATNVSAGWTDVFRTAGSLIVLCLGVLLLSAVPQWRTWLAVLGLAAGASAAFLGYREMITLHGIGIHHRSQMELVRGLMSNVNLYASYLNLLLPLCIFASILQRGFFRVLAGAISVAILLMIILLQTRAAYVGLATGFAAVCLIGFFFWQQLGLSRRSRWLLLFVGPAVFASVAGFLILAEGNVLAERLKTLLGGIPTSADGGRLVIWKLTLQMALDHWLTGVGAGNFTVCLHDYFDIDNPDFQSIHPNWVQPHNDFLWVFAEKGVLGFAAFFGIFCFAFLNLVRALRNAASPQSAWCTLMTIMALATYAAGSFFDFPQERVNHQVLLALYLAVAVVSAPREQKLWPTFGANIRVASLRVTILSAMSVVAIGTVYGLLALRQERLVLRARLALAEDDWENLTKYAALAATRWKTLDPFVTPVAFLEGLGHMFEARHSEALDRFEKARDQIPSRIYITKHVGLLAEMRGDYTTAVDAFQRALQRNPQNADTIVRLAGSLASSGDPDQALRLLDSVPAEKRGEDFIAVRQLCQASDASMRDKRAAASPEQKRLASLARREEQVPAGKPEMFDRTKTARLRSAINNWTVFGKSGLVSEGASGAIFLHPSVEGPTTVSFGLDPDLRKKTTFSFWIDPLPPGVGDGAGTVAVELFSDGISLGPMVVNRDRNAVYKVDLAQSSELTIRVDCLNGSEECDWLMFGVSGETSDR